MNDLNSQDKPKPPRYGQYATSGQQGHSQASGNSQPSPRPAGSGKPAPRKQSTNPNTGPRQQAGGFAGAFTPGAPKVKVGQAFAFGWKSFTNNAAVWLMYSIVGVVLLFFTAFPYLQVVIEWFQDLQVYVDAGITPGMDTVPDQLALFSLPSLLLYAGHIIFTGLLALGVVAALKVANGDRLTPATVFAPARLGKLLLAGMLLGLIALALVPTLLGVLVWQVAAVFIIPAMADGELGLMEGLKESLVLVTRSIGSVLAVLVVVILVNIVGLLALGVGTMVTVPVSVSAVAYTYRVLSGGQVPEN